MISVFLLRTAFKRIIKEHLDWILGFFDITERRRKTTWCFLSHHFTVLVWDGSGLHICLQRAKGTEAESSPLITQLREGHIMFSRIYHHFNPNPHLSNAPLPARQKTSSRHPRER